MPKLEDARVRPAVSIKNPFLKFNDMAAKIKTPLKNNNLF